MALTVRPDDEVYQFDTVWLGPDEYTLPIQARYVAWGTWLACFLVAAAVLVPLGGDGPAGVLGSLVWALAVSVVLSRAVMLVVDHERPLRSLPALFSAEARAAVAARRGAERALLVRPGRVRVGPTPAKVHAIRDRQRRRAELHATRRGRVPAVPAVPVEPAGSTRAVEPVAADPGSPLRPEWTPDLSPAASGYDDWADQPAPGWSIPADPHDGPPESRHPVADPALPTADQSADRTTRRTADRVTDADRDPGRDAGPHRDPRGTAIAPHGTAIAPHGGRHARRDGRRPEPADRQAAVEARILLPVKKER